MVLLTALLDGSILLNMFKEELPSTGRLSFGWFLAGLALYAGLLTVVTALGGDVVGPRSSAGGPSEPGRRSPGASQQ